MAGVVRDANAKVDLDKAVKSGGLVVVHFWATWCPPCVAAMPTLRQAQAAHRTDGLEIVSISADASADAVKAFVAREGNAWSQWRTGPSGVVSRDWSNSSYPFYILVDRQGRIVAADQQLAVVLRAVGPALRQ